MKWWGYLHKNGSLQVKRFFDMGDLAEARASDFVQLVSGVVEADGREDAVERVAKNLGLVRSYPNASAK